LILFVQRTLLQMPAIDLQDLLLVAVNLKHPQPLVRILQHMQQHKQLLYAGIASSSCTFDNSSSSVQLVEHLTTTALARAHWEAAPMLAATPAAQQLGLQQVSQLLALSIQMEPFVSHVSRHQLVGNEGPIEIAAL
jgi:hypothetical protein